MTFHHYLLPRLTPQMYTFLDLQMVDNIPEPVISESLSYYLIDIKKQINLCEQEWDVYKKYTNPYEYIHTIIPGKKYCVSKYRPLSRAFFKLYELIHFFGLNAEKAGPIRTFHLAEGPGGFIEAIVKYRNNPADHYIGMTLLDSTNRDYNIPGWKKSQSFLQANPNVMIESGYDKTGNILSLDNLVYVNKMYGGSMDLITGDGGFDFSSDFDNQEVNMARLLFAQVAFAISMQRQGGCFVLKIFDVVMQHTVDLLALLSSLYDQVYITKPNTSRIANSEKYVVCKGFLLNSTYKIFPCLYKVMRRMIGLSSTGSLDQSSVQYISRFLSPNAPIQYHFLNRLEESNVLIGQSQIENIYLTLSYIMDGAAGGGTEGGEAAPITDLSSGVISLDTSKNDVRTRSIGGVPRRMKIPSIKSRINNMIKMNVQRCITWCGFHNLAYNF
jgi:FtsJ-like methyltransferase